MRPIFSFIFELITDPLALPISPLWEYLILLVLGEIAFRIAWEASPGGFGGSAIHWFVRAIAFVAMWAAAYAVIAVAKFVIAHWVPIMCVIGGLTFAGIILAVILKLLTDIETDGDDSHLRSTFSPVAQIKFSIDLNNFTVSVYNDHTGELDYLAEIKDRNASLVSFLLMFERINRDLPFERKQQTIVYCNGRNKAIENALAFADQLSEIQDNDLNALARDITNEVHGDYYLAQIIKKGVAYHIGYLPAAIRMRIEDMFRRGKITTMFCTSTLLEGVNLPADNLFITDNKIFRKVMTPVDFRNLIGRVGRIRFNLYGNVFFVSQGEKLKQEDYVDLLKKEVPKQTLSIEAGPKSLTNAEKKYVVEALLQGNIELVKRHDLPSGTQRQDRHGAGKRCAFLPEWR